MAEQAYGQQEPMENEAMERTLDTQARAIWPQERTLLQRLFQHPGLDVLDVGCGTGEISSRMVREFSPRSVTGIDLSEVNLARARRKFPAAEYPGLSFHSGDGTAMPFGDDRFDIAICRHMLQAIPDPEAAIREMIRVVKPGGSLYFLAEDYGMLFFHPTEFDADVFWRDYAGKAAALTGSNLRQGRTMPYVLATMGCSNITADYICLDTLRIERGLLAGIFTHWKEGFDKWITQFTGHPLEDVQARFNDMIECVKSETGYALWLIPSVSARVTAEAKKTAR